MMNTRAIFEKNAGIFGNIYNLVSRDDAEGLAKIFDRYPDFINIPVYGGIGGGLSLMHRAATEARRMG